ncbi:MAG: glycerol-3-phosphate dehydrogenase/oxidase [Candidatus Nanopelagicales bacterium]
MRPIARPIIRPISPGDQTSLLNRERRTKDRDALANGEFVDVLVVGGGVTGTGVALDAATRGLSVALVEANDFAFGTSRWSSKLVHGGLRYLAGGHINIAWESALERSILMQNVAPHLIRALPQMVPEYDTTARKYRTLTRVGLYGADAMRKASKLPGSRLAKPKHISGPRAAALAPSLPAERIEGAMLLQDGQLEDDARLVVAIARTAAAYGAKIVTHAKATDLGPGGATIEDTLDGGTFQLNARTVVNATGIWAAQNDSRISLNPSRGSHLVLASSTLGDSNVGIALPVPDHFGRYVFTMPQPDGLTYVGITDVDAGTEIPDVPMASEEEIQWILDILSDNLSKPIERDQVIGTYAGLRPLVAGGEGEDAKSSADISREHLVLGEAGGVITVTGGKLTTYRKMAQDTVDKITDKPCLTKKIPLVGAGGSLAGTSVADIPARLKRRYGTEASLVSALSDRDPSLLEPIVASDLAEYAHLVPALKVEFAWAVEAEGAMTVEDLVERRVRFNMVDGLADLAIPVAESLLD